LFRREWGGGGLNKNFRREVSAQLPHPILNLTPLPPPSLDVQGRGRGYLKLKKKDKSLSMK